MSETFVSSKEKYQYNKWLTCINLLLIKILFDLPEILEELPMILTSLDNGETINISKIKNEKKKNYYIIFFNLLLNLPTKNNTKEIIIKQLNNNEIYYKENENSLKRFLLVNNLQLNFIKEPSQLTTYEKNSSLMSPIHFLKLINDYFLLNFNEIKLLINNLLDNNGINLKNIKKIKLKNLLKKFLLSLGMVKDDRDYSDEDDEVEEENGENDLEVDDDDEIDDDENDVLMIPKGRNGDDVVEALETYLDLFEDYKKALKISDFVRFYLADEKDEDQFIMKKIVENSSTTISSSSSSLPTSSSISSSSSSSSSDKVQGPALPTMEDIKKAQELLASNPPPPDSESESEDDSLGPLPQDPSKITEEERNSFNNLPLAHVGVNLYKDYTEGNEISTYTEGAKREEWILDPGSNKSIFEINGGMPTARKFQTGKGAKKKAEEVMIQEEYKRQLELKALEDFKRKGTDSVEQEKVEEPYRPSLMEEHQSKKFKQSSFSSEKKAWDREKVS